MLSNISTSLSLLPETERLQCLIGKLHSNGALDFRR